MRVSEIIGKMIDWNEGLSLAPKSEQPNTAEYANTPHEVEQSIATTLAQGDDVNKPKHPSDIRTNAPSMYPNFQAKG